MEDGFIAEDLVSSVERKAETPEVSEGAPTFPNEGPVEQFEAVGLRDRLQACERRVAGRVDQRVSTAGFCHIQIGEPGGDTGEGRIGFGHDRHCAGCRDLARGVVPIRCGLDRTIGVCRDWPSRFYGWDEAARSRLCILRVPLPACLLSRLASLSQQFTRPTWRNALLLLTGAILASGKRTVTAVLRILGREQDTDFPIYHGVLNRAVWSSRAVASWLLRLLVASFLNADATVVIGLDDTIERRWGHKIRARGIYRDPVRSSKGHFVKPAASWACPFSSCLRRPSASMPTRHARPSRCWTGPVRPLCRSTAGCRVAVSSSSVTPHWPPSASSLPSEAISVSSPDCASTPIFMPPHHPDADAAKNENRCVIKIRRQLGQRAANALAYAA